MLAQDLLDVFRLPLIGGGQPDREAFTSPAGDLLRHLGEFSSVLSHRARVQREPGGTGGSLDQLELQALAARDPLAERPPLRRLLVDGLEQLR